MPDPFPDASTLYDKDNAWISEETLTMEKLVYPPTRYNELYSPMPIYLPNRYIMIKMMRASIGCATPADLWFN